MQLFEKRSNYTENGKLWPIVPTTLSRDVCVLECIDKDGCSELSVYSPAGMVPKVEDPESYVLKILANEPKIEVENDEKNLDSVKKFEDIPCGLQEYIVTAIKELTKIPDDARSYICDAMITYADADVNELISVSLKDLAENLKNESVVVDKRLRSHLLYALKEYKGHLPESLRSFVRVKSAGDTPCVKMPYGWEFFVSIKQSTLVYYNNGLIDTHILGWSMGLSEEMGRPVVVWQRAFCDKKANEWSKIRDISGTGFLKEENERFYLGLKKLETKEYYQVMSPICGVCKERNSEFKKKCEHQDVEAVSKVFKVLDDYDGEGLRKRRDEILEKINDGMSEGIAMSIDFVGENKEVLYFTYICSLLCKDSKVTEVIYPIFCEDILVAMVMIGQIGENIENMKQAAKGVLRESGSEEQAISDINDMEKNLEKRKDSYTKYGVKEVAALIHKHSGELLSIYREQLEGERRKVMNRVLDKITDFLSFLNIGEANSDEEMKGALSEFYTNCLTHIGRSFGVKRLFLYLDTENHYECELDKKKIGPESYWSLSKHYDKPEEKPCSADLFAQFKVKEQLMDYDELDEKTRGKIPNEKDSNWSVFTYRGSDSGSEPIVIGVNYYSADNDENGLPRDEKETDRNHYHNARRAGAGKTLDWETFVLPKLAVYIQNALSVYSERRMKITLNDHSIFLEHEVGQIAAAVRALNFEFEKYLDDEKKKLSAKHKSAGYYNALEEYYQTFYEKAELYRGDMEGNFGLIEILSKFDENVKPIPQVFDIYRQFLNKWRLAFTSQCRRGGKHLVLPSVPTSSHHIRRICTSPVLLETIIYNIVNNAIKYSYANTRVYVSVEKSEDDNCHVFTITDYGDYFKEGNNAIFEKGNRGHKEKNMFNLSETSYDDVGNKDVEGAGMGLYWSKILIDKLHGSISYKCSFTPVCKYNIPLMKPFMERYGQDPFFSLFWAEMDKLIDIAGIELDVDKRKFENLKEEYDRLTSEGKWGIYVNVQEGTGFISKQMDKISIYTLYEQIVKPTHEIKFIVKIPNFREDAEE